MNYPEFPVLEGDVRLSVEHGHNDETISSKMENGLRITRVRFPRIRRTWPMELSAFGQSDCDELLHFRDKVVFGGAGAFYILLPVTDERVLVRFLPDKTPKPKEVGMDENGPLYSVSFEIEEV